MRSPMIAFSLFAAAAVSPTLVAAAPQSPKFSNDGFSHPRNTAMQLPQRFAFPRAADPISGLTKSVLPGGSSSTPEPEVNQPLAGDNGQPDAKSAVKNAKAADRFSSVLNHNNNDVVQDAETTTGRSPVPPKEPVPPTAPRLPQGPDYTPETPITDDGNPEGHNGATPAIPRTGGNLGGSDKGSPAADVASEGALP